MNKLTTYLMINFVAFLYVGTFFNTQLTEINLNQNNDIYISILEMIYIFCDDVN